MKFSIIIPVYNCADILHISVDSILAQTYTDWELILVNDGSTDESLSLCRDYAQKESRIRVISQENQGQGVARNNGMRAARGDYIVFCDSDDFYDITALRDFANGIDDTKADLVVSSYHEYRLESDNSFSCCGERESPDFSDYNRNSIHKRFVYLYSKGLITAPWGKAYRRGVIENNTVKFAPIRRCEDTIFNLRFYDSLKSVAGISQFTYNYQTPADDSFTRKMPENMFEINVQLYDLIEEYLKSWNVYDKTAEAYFNSRYLRDTLIQLRLNQENQWKKTPEEQKCFSQKILSNSKTIQAAKRPTVGVVNYIVKKVISTQSVTIVKLLNSMILCLKREDET